MVGNPAVFGFFELISKETRLFYCFNIIIIIIIITSTTAIIIIIIIIVVMNVS